MLSTNKVQHLFCGVSAATDSGGQVMPNDRLPKQLLFGQLKALRPPACSRSSFNDVVLSDCQNCRISTSCRDAHNRLLWPDKTCPACMYLAHHEPESIKSIIS